MSCRQRSLLIICPVDISLYGSHIGAIIRNGMDYLLPRGMRLSASSTLTLGDTISGTLSSVIAVS